MRIIERAWCALMDWLDRVRRYLHRPQAPVRITDLEPHVLGTVRLPRGASRWMALVSVDYPPGRCTGSSRTLAAFGAMGSFVVDGSSCSGVAERTDVATIPITVWLEAHGRELRVMAENKSMMPWDVWLRDVRRVEG